MGKTKELSVRDGIVLYLVQMGLSARKVSERMDGEVSVQVVQRRAREHLGPVPPNKNSRLHSIGRGVLYDYVSECFRRLGKDPFMCEICEEPQKKKCQIHHTKYEGCTVYDLQYVCQSCNLARVNMGLT